MTIYGPIIDRFSPQHLSYCMSKGYVFEPSTNPKAVVEYFMDCENGSGPYRFIGGVHRRPDGTFVARSRLRRHSNMCGRA
ncbi:MAG: hypothetical protein L0K65_00280 [Actinomyces sp.]|nr:hypothetical protein [Actinomyces sp.]